MSWLEFGNGTAHTRCMTTPMESRKCAICGGNKGSITCYAMPLRWWGFTGRYAHPKCFRLEQARRVAQERRQLAKQPTAPQSQKGRVDE